MGFEARLMHVTKMHGARNDFVVVDLRRELLRDVVSFARWACDRRAGIGADGLIAIETSQEGDVRMRTINADGSEAEMCGNGIRCAARWLEEAGEGDRIAFETDAGIVSTEVVAREPEYLVRVAMGRPKLGLVASVPAATFVDMGNPHVVIIENAANPLDIEVLAREFQTDPAFPGGTNVHLASLGTGGALLVRHWERGVGTTPACGTGAVASAAVAIEKNLASSPVDVFVPGGRLTVEWDGNGIAHLVGPAVRVFDAEIDLARVV
jgi:diaminopimelate epimerase